MKSICYYGFLLLGILFIPLFIDAETGDFSTRLVDLPYSQDFDGTIPPAMPGDWLAINNSQITGCFVGTTSYAYYSAPNSVLLSNASDLNSNLMLILPQISDEVNIAHTKLRFMARSNLSGQRMELGFVNTPTEPESFVVFQNIEGISDTWTEVNLRFQNYHGTNRYLAIRHPVSGYNRQLFIDDIVWEDAEVHDLGVISIYGNPTPSITVQSSYQIMIRNYGLVAQDDYQIKLFRGNEIELAVVDGQSIAAQETQVLNVTWTPQNLGTDFLYAKIILAGDQNTANDHSSFLPVIVQPDDGYQIVPPYDVILARNPIDVYWKNSLSQCIFLASELYNVSGVISEMKLWNSFVDYVPQKPIKIWLGMTTEANLSAGFIPAGQLSLVYDGILDFPMGQNIIQITFDAGFTYINSHNLVMMIHSGYTDQYYSLNNNFHARATAAGGIRYRRVSSDTVIYDPFNPPAASTGLAQMPIASFLFQPLALGAFHGVVSGSSNQALEGVRIEVSPLNTVIYSDIDGFFSLSNLLPGNYQLSYSLADYQVGTQNVQVVGDQTTALTYNMVEFERAAVLGRIVSSEYPEGIANVMIRLDGPQTYTGGSNSDGYFCINGVYTGHPYSFGIHSHGWQYQSGSIILGSDDYDFGVITL